MWLRDGPLMRDAMGSSAKTRSHNGSPPSSNPPPQPPPQPPPRPSRPRDLYTNPGQYQTPDLPSFVFLFIRPCFMESIPDNLKSVEPESEHVRNSPSYNKCLGDTDHRQALAVHSPWRLLNHTTRACFGASHCLLLAVYRYF
jgi:hypothetical protein